MKPAISRSLALVLSIATLACGPARADTGTYDSVEWLTSLADQIGVYHAERIYGPYTATNGSCCFSTAEFTLQKALRGNPPAIYARTRQVEKPEQLGFHAGDTYIFFLVDKDRLKNVPNHGASEPIEDIFFSMGNYLWLERPPREVNGVAIDYKGRVLTNRDEIVKLIEKSLTLPRANPGIDRWAYFYAYDQSGALTNADFNFQQLSFPTPDTATEVPYGMMIDSPRLIIPRSLVPTNSSPQWAALTDAKKHFHFDYPASWKVNTETVPVEHYREVFVALNSFGAEHFTSREQEISPNTWEYGANTVTNQLPDGSIYFDIGWWEGPGPLPRFGPGIQEMEDADLSKLLRKQNSENMDPGLITRNIRFNKWGRRWSIVVYFRTPVTGENERIVSRILNSFRFDGVPAGDEIWAIGEARKHLPPEADPDQYTREGGSSVYYCETKPDGQDVLVTFTKHLAGDPPKTWSFRVTETGAVTSYQKP